MIGGETVDGAFWRGVREHSDAFFGGDEPLWRLSLPSTSPPLELEGRQLIEWNGGLRWLSGEGRRRALRGGCAA